MKNDKPKVHSNQHSSDSHASTDCTPYPSNLKSLDECCKHPILFDDEITGTCDYLCAEDEEDKDNPDCPYNCMLINNNVVKKQKVNVTALEFIFDKYGIGDPDWHNITHDGIKQCDLKYEVGHLKENYEKFEGCMTSFYRSHCVEFKEPVECDAVEDFMLKCQHIKPNCAVWPRHIVKLPEFCCDNRPELFSKDLQDKAEDYCSDQDIISKAGTMQCLANYLLNITSIKAAKKWNFAIAKKLLTENSKDDAKWTATIEKTVETCEKQVHGLLLFT